MLFFLMQCTIFKLVLLSSTRGGTQWLNRYMLCTVMKTILAAYFVPSLALLLNNCTCILTLNTICFVGNEEVEEVFAEDYDDPMKDDPVLPEPAVETRVQVPVEEEEDDSLREVKLV